MLDPKSETLPRIMTTFIFSVISLSTDFPKYWLMIIFLLLLYAWNHKSFLTKGRLYILKALNTSAWIIQARLILCRLLIMCVCVCVNVIINYIEYK